MTRLAFLVAGDDRGLAPALARLLAAEAPGLGLEAQVHAGSVPPPRPDQVDVVVTAGRRDPLPAALAADPARLARTLLLSVDRPGSPAFEPLLAAASRVGRSMSIDFPTATELTARWAPTQFLPLGYSPALDVWDRDRERDVDVVLIGPRSARRDGLAGRFAGLERRHRVAGWADPALSLDDEGPALADPRRSLLARARVAVLVHAAGEPGQGVDWCGALDAILAGAAVVVERSSDLAPLAAGTHVLSASTAALPATVEALLDDPARIDGLRTAAYDLLRGAPPLAAALGQLVGQAWELLAGTWNAEAFTPEARTAAASSSAR